MRERKGRLFTSESVTEGHPDKVCDQISDAVLDAIIELDPMARVACETLVNTGLVVVTGEITTDCYVDISKIVRKTIKEIGYTRAKFGFDGDTCAVVTAIEEQSPDIAIGVNKALEAKEGIMSSDELGAGDQKRLAEVRKKKLIPYLRPDGKTQVTIEYDNDHNPVRIDTVVVSTQHKDGIRHEKIESDLVENVIKAVLPAQLLDKQTRFFINPTGSFVVGGPQADSGLTGRKIIVDTYGGYARHGGGAFSGKDPTKVDRSAAYAARYVAKNIVAAGLARKCEIQLAYAIGVAEPVSVDIETFGTNRVDEKMISRIVSQVFDLRPSSIIKMLGLRKPIYRQIAAYGHFGRKDLDLSWEKTDRAGELKKLADGADGGDL